MTELLPAGIGLGFRFQHAPVILRDKPDTPWFELIADDLLLSSGRQPVIEKLREHYPIALHAVGLNIAGPDPLDTDYLRALASVYQHTEAAWLSDHLCWSAAGQRQHFDLLPFAFTHDMLDYLCPRIHHVQQHLKRPLVLENISYYQRFQNDEMGEWEFTAELIKRTDCKMLLDLNNLWTNARNFDLEPSTELDTLMRYIPADGIMQIHVAGSKFHSDHRSANGYWVDTHGEQVPAGVCDLLKTTYAAYGEIPTIIERDNNLPSFDELERERQTLLETVHG
ncbi:DUF692 domain-containing protein [Leucothrix pacifica]|uniref:DUF692 domain-containing protein n=1 Tax=Leucothrix pacifica TaxID=1247513 RepID=A0A317CI70_9GAMM|nr:DUF692 domain-containing protein [Leucothrix pacifica]PWQ97967.1 hypothetical protein DKW60_09075 [Leucothrix pacifica]